MSANSKQVNGTHYKKLAYEPWDLALDIGMNGVMLFLTKYIARWRDKNGIEDLEKALHCIEKLQEFGFLNIKGFFITRIVKLVLSYLGLGKYLGYTKNKMQKLDSFCEQLPLNEALIIKKAALGEFEDAKAEIRKLILEEEYRQEQNKLQEYINSVKEEIKEGLEDMGPIPADDIGALNVAGQKMANTLAKALDKAAEDGVISSTDYFRG